MNFHRCQANGCTTPVLVCYLMCARHHALIPESLRWDLCNYYRPGQEVGRVPRWQWVQAARSAVAAVTVAEEAGKTPPTPRET